MATAKQVKYVKALQQQSGRHKSEMYSDKKIKAMSHKEVSGVIEKLQREIDDDALYNECMSNGLPNQ